MKGHNRGADLWALGAVIYEMLVGQTPFVHEDATQQSLFHSILSGEFDFPDKDLHGIDVSLDAQDLIAKLLDLDPDKRLVCLGGDKLQEHVWFGGMHRDGKVRKKVLKAPWIPEISDPMDTCHFASFEEAEEEDFGEIGEITPVAEGDDDDGDDIFADF
jgi:serine/threonine protein kinase